MGCPYHSGSTDSDSDSERTATDRADDRNGLDRREFAKSALLIGGTSALASLTGLFGVPETATADDTGRSVGVTDRANRQHAWNAYERRAHGTSLPPEHHLLLLADYEGNGEPTAEHRDRAKKAFDRLERAFDWHHQGLLFTVGYSTSYFERFEEDPPRGLQTDNGAIPRFMSARQLVDGPTIPIPDPDRPDFQPAEDEAEEERRVDLTVTLPREDPVADDDYDVCIHLASDHVRNLLSAEAALWGELETVDGVSFAGVTLEGVFTKPTSYPDRRVGFVGNDALEEEVEVGEADSAARDRFEASVEEGAELSMGYNDLYRNSMPREDNVTMLEDQRFLPGAPNWQPPGVFANGSIMHVSRLDNDLEGWYGENTDTERRHRMFSPHHTDADVGSVGENLGPRESNAPVASEKPADERLPMRDLSNDVEDVAERTQDDYEAGRHIGHAQKTARARAQLEAHFRNEDGGPPVVSPQRDDPVADERADDLPGTDGRQAVETGFLRRDFNTVDDGRPGTHFVALQAFSIYLAYMRHAMNGVDFDTAMIAQPTTEGPTAGFEHDADDSENPDHGILGYVTTERRGNFVVPPVRQRALPHARATKLVEADTHPETGAGGTPLPPYADPDGEFTLERDGERYRLTLDADPGAALDPESVRFGFYRAVNAGAGASPVAVEDGDERVTFVFDVTETTLPEQLEREATDDESPDDNTVRARLYAERAANRKPVMATTTVSDPTDADEILELLDLYDDGDVDVEAVLDAITEYNAGE